MHLMTPWNTAIHGDLSPLYIPPGQPQLREPAIQHFHDKLVLIRDRLKTAPGKVLGEKRHNVVGFLSFRHSGNPLS
jgi:hypothetical protein